MRNLLRTYAAACRTVAVLLALAWAGSVEVRAQFLSPGDLAIVGMNMTDPNEFSFVALVDIPAGTEIRFTDNGWTSGGTFREEEDVMIYTAPVDLNRGTVVVINGTVGQVPGLASSGDQLFAYQVAADGSPRFIFGINNTPGDGWQEDAVTDHDTTLPTQLINGFTAVSLPWCRNVVYTGVAIGRQAELLIWIANPAGWICQNAHHLNLALPPFTVTGILNNIPTFSRALPDTTLPVGALLDFRYEASDPDGQTVLFTASQLPSGAVIAPTNGVLRWVPGPSQVGSHIIRVGASDGISTTYVSATVTVTTNTGVEDGAQPGVDGHPLLDVWPNPASSRLDIALRSTGNGIPDRDRVLRIHDSLGRLRVRMPLDQARTSLDVGSWPAGVYLLSTSGQESGAPPITARVLIMP
ncbi:MAG: T9SS type A sorting domain-containing protein [Rhodothermales bacterium]